MANRPLPDQATLLKLLRYDPETGKLYWRERTPDMFVTQDLPRYNKSPEGACAAWNAKNAHRLAFTALTGGYGHGTIFGQKYRAHRLIWKMVFGDEPVFIDHQNGDRSDNRLSNLRNVSRAENALNRAMRKDNTSGVNGVQWNADFRCWRAFICKDGKPRGLGSFQTKQEAVDARLSAEAEMGFHPNHGRPA